MAALMVVAEEDELNRCLTSIRRHSSGGRGCFRLGQRGLDILAGLSLSKQPNRALHGSILTVASAPDKLIDTVMDEKFYP